ncbi:MAG: urea amidolyase associated protein UAAP1 [Devosia sp.]
MSRTSAQIAADRARYEAHQQAGLAFATRALPEASPKPAAPIPAGDIIAAETIAGGWYWSTLLRKGEALRIAQTSGSAAVALGCWNAKDTSERLNLPDTVKVQWDTRVQKGRVLFSDMGRVLLSVTEDSSGGAHDLLAGGSTAASNTAKYPGAATRNTRDNLVLAAGKLGLSRRDLPMALTLFAPVRVSDDEGTLGWRADLATGSDYVDLRAEMDVLVALSTCPHPLDPAPDYAPNPVDITRYRATVAADDLCRSATAEAVRGFENNLRAEA